jgi:type 1 fimbriae regulatory protein FimB
MVYYWHWRKAPKRSEVRNMHRMQPMTLEQAQALRQTAQQAGVREHAIISLMLSHFIRASELAGTDREGTPTGLRVSDLNMRDGSITIRRLKGSVTKTEGLMTGEREALAAWLQIKPESEWLFPGRDITKPMTRRQVGNIFHDLCLRAGIPAASAAPHASRHTLGQILFENGVDIKTIQAAAGHKSLNSCGQYMEPRQQAVDSAKAKALGMLETVAA